MNADLFRFQQGLLQNLQELGRDCGHVADVVLHTAGQRVQDGLKAAGVCSNGQGSIHVHK